MKYYCNIKKNEKVKNIMHKMISEWEHKGSVTKTKVFEKVIWKPSIS